MRRVRRRSPQPPWRDGDARGAPAGEVLVGGGGGGGSGGEGVGGGYGGDEPAILATVAGCWSRRVFRTRRTGLVSCNFTDVDYGQADGRRRSPDRTVKIDVPSTSNTSKLKNNPFQTSLLPPSLLLTSVTFSI
jgi:hypothetical protein